MKLLRDIIKQKSTKAGPATERDEVIAAPVIQRSDSSEKAEAKEASAPSGEGERVYDEDYVASLLREDAPSEGSNKTPERERAAPFDEQSLPAFIKTKGQAGIQAEPAFRDDVAEVEPSDTATTARKPTPSEPTRTGQPDSRATQVNENNLSRKTTEDVVEKIVSEARTPERAEQKNKVASGFSPGDKPGKHLEPVAGTDSAPLQLTREQLASDPADIPIAIEVPPPAAGRNKNRAGRAKTRLLGFNTGADAADNPFAKGANTQEETHTNFPVGWLVVTDGPGHGAGFTLYGGVAQIGRGEGQTVRLDFGDNSISRENHAAIAYDAEQNTFFIGHGGKANLVRCNDMPVLSTQALDAGDKIRIGETTLRFVPLCGPDFQWQEQPGDETSYAQRG